MSRESVLILKDETSLQILKEVCEEKKIPLQSFSELIRWAYKNKRSNNTGISAEISRLIDDME